MIFKSAYGQVMAHIFRCFQACFAIFSGPVLYCASAQGVIAFGAIIRGRDLHFRPFVSALLHNCLLLLRFTSVEPHTRPGLQSWEKAVDGFPS